MKKPYTLSVTVITLNEEDRIGQCLASVKSIADEIIVLDSGSSDRTVEIAKSYGAQVFETDWPGYGVQKQRALEKATCQWVLSMDADESISKELSDEIDARLRNNPSEVAYELPRTVHLWGKSLAYGNMSRKILRLFKRDAGYFTDSKVHEKIVVSGGKVGVLKNSMDHYSIRDFEHYLQKNMEYAWLGAKKKHAANKRGSLLAAVFSGCWVFFKNYILKRGFLDGRIGFLAACMYSQYAFNKYVGLWTLQREDRLKSEQ